MIPKNHANKKTKKPIKIYKSSTVVISFSDSIRRFTAKNSASICFSSWIPFTKKFNKKTIKRAHKNNIHVSWHNVALIKNAEIKISSFSKTISGIEL